VWVYEIIHDENETMWKQTAIDLCWNIIARLNVLLKWKTKAILHSQNSFKIQEKNIVELET
jgi:hypothetical protein